MNNMLRLPICPAPRSLSPTSPVKKHMGSFAIPSGGWVGGNEGKKKETKDREMQVEGFM